MEVYQGYVKNDTGQIMTVSDIYENEEAVNKWKENILSCFTAMLEHNIEIRSMKVKSVFK